MKLNEENHPGICSVCSVRPFFIAVFAGLSCLICVSCHTSRQVSQVSTTERHEVFDSIAETDTCSVVGNTTFIDSATVNIQESRTDTIRIDRDSVGRPTLIIWSRNSNFIGRLTDANFSKLNLTRSHTTAERKTTGTVDHTDKKEKESTTEIHSFLSIATVIGWIFLSLILIYLIYILIVNLWPHLKKLISSRLLKK